MSLTGKRLLILSFVFIGVAALAFLVVKLAQGYRPDLSNRTLRPTGLLVATSEPEGAQLWVDGKLRSATDTTLNLAPNEYDVEIKKDGYFTWKKKLTIKKELVAETDAYLFSTVPDLKSLTFTGAERPLLSPDGQKVVYAVTTASASKRGLWILDLADRPLGLARQPRQIIASAPGGRDFSQADYEWSPDSKQVLVSLQKTKTATESFLLDTDKLNSSTSLIDITTTVKLLKTRWETEAETQFQAQFSKLPEKLTTVISETVKNLRFSPDETKILYEATASATLPDEIIPPLPATSTQTQTRKLEPGKTYVYDLKEDCNFQINLPENNKLVSWFPTSKHIFLVQNDRISLVEYDNTNKIDIYTGPFENSFSFPFPAGNRLLVLASIGQDTPPNLYAITLR